MIFNKSALFYLYAVLGFITHSNAQIHPKRTQRMEIKRKLHVADPANDSRNLLSKLDIQHTQRFNAPESPKSQILRHRHKHDSNGSRTSDSSYSKSEDGGESDDEFIVEIPERPGFALRGITAEDLLGAEGKEDEGRLEEEGTAGTKGVSTTEGKEMKTEEGSFGGSILDVANSVEELSEFVRASKIAGVDEVLSDGRSFTIFAPTNQVFASQSQEFLQTYFSGDWNKHLEDFLLSHIAENRLLFEELTNEMQVELLNDDVLFVTLDPPKIDEDIGISTVDIKGSNSVIHEIDDARLPLSTTVNVVEFLELATILDDIPYSFSSFLEYSTLANLTDAFSTASPITLFVPTDEAFKKSGEEGLLTYLGDNMNALGKVLANHGTVGNMYSDQLDGGIQTYEASLVVGKKEGKIEIMSVPDEITANVVEMDVIARNGVIHVVDSLLVPEDVLKAFRAM